MNDRQTRLNALKLFATGDLIFGGVGLLFLTIGLGWLGWNVVWNSGTATVTGKVVRLVGMDAGRGRGRGSMPVAEYEVEGRKHEVSGLMSTSPPAHAVGDSVTIRYRVASPAEAVLATFVNRWLRPAGFTVFGIISTLIGGRTLFRRVFVGREVSETTLRSP